MRTVDLTPLYRSTVGFDRFASLLDSAMSRDVSAPTFPPYNIEKLDDDAYRITLAVAGFSEADLSIEACDGQLTVSGAKTPAQAEKASYLHRGIAERSFERRFHLADHVRVTEASLENGLLHIALAREVPEALKPRKIAISQGGGAKAIEAQAA